MEKLEVGIIGCGNNATRRHAPCYKRDKRCTLVAALDRNPEALPNLSKTFDIPKTYPNLDDFLNEDLNVVSICAPLFNHAELAIAYLKKGLNVLVEKPMAMNVGGMPELVIHGKTGFLVNSWDLSSYVKYVKNLLTKKISDKYGFKGERTYYSWSAVIQKYETVYSEFVNKKCPLILYCDSNSVKGVFIYY